MTPTIPLGCYANENAIRDGFTSECYITIVIDFPSEGCALKSVNTGLTLTQLSDVQARCGSKIKGFYPFDIFDGSDLVMNSTSIYVTSVYFSKSDAINRQVSFVTTSTGSHKIWKLQNLGSVWVNTNTDTGFKENEDNTCYARVDPHMMTIDKMTYEHQVGGEFILYKHDDYPIEVQERTTKCNNNQAYCTCAVGIRAGGDVFLINLCGGLKEIGMTSCKDGGSLTIQKYNEYEYQIFTNIGTMIVIKIHSGNYKNLMDVTIHMVPKDFKKTKGLCGIFDGSKENDYHDREGKKVPLDDFREHWRLTFEDVNLLKPGCSIPVEKWEDSVKSLFCMCNCTLETAASTTSVNCPVDDHTAICSTSQYINCTVENDVTSILCTEFNQKCNHGSKRSVSYLNRHIEQARRAKLADNKSKTIFKRTPRETVSITDEMAGDMCRQNVTNSMASNMTNLLMGLNISKIIDECASDVFLGQDAGWIEPALVMIKDAVKAGYKRDANYTMTHEQDYEEFMTQTCPMNCSGNGKCNSKGQCECNIGWFGPDCSNDFKEGPITEDVEADGLCDQIYGSECRCFYIQTNVLATNFSCKGQMRKRYLDGATETLTTETGYGEYYNIYNGRCCFEKRGRRSLVDKNNTTMELYINELEVVLTNDGVNFGPPSTIYIYDSSCVNISKINGTVFFDLKINTCQINGLCYEEGYSANDACFKCKSTESQFSWSYDCPEEKAKGKSDHKNVIIAICFSIMSGLVIITSIGIFAYKKLKPANATGITNGESPVMTTKMTISEIGVVVDQ